jgi:3-oxoadipate enol-lactonase
LILLHGWTATADLNWFTAYEPLAEHFRVVALDQRGHGGGIRGRGPFRLTDCADDVVALADELGVDRFVPVGYSMGGAVAQLVWRRHADRTAGLVLCATSGYFANSTRERVPFAAMAGLGMVTRVAPPQAVRWITDRVYLRRKTAQWSRWAAEQIAAHDWRHILEAGAALGGHDARAWLGEIDVPSSVVITTRDRVVSTRRQERLASSIPGAAVRRVDADHDAVFAAAERFVPDLVGACLDATARDVRR